jgi:hypothetical protein
MRSSIAAHAFNWLSACWTETFLVFSLMARLLLTAPPNQCPRWTLGSCEPLHGWHNTTKVEENKRMSMHILPKHVLHAGRFRSVAKKILRKLCFEGVLEHSRTSSGKLESRGFFIHVLQCTNKHLVSARSRLFFTLQLPSSFIFFGYTNERPTGDGTPSQLQQLLTSHQLGGTSFLTEIDSSEERDGEENVDTELELHVQYSTVQYSTVQPKLKLGMLHNVTSLKHEFLVEPLGLRIINVHLSF